MFKLKEQEYIVSQIITIYKDMRIKQKFGGVAL